MPTRNLILLVEDHADSREMLEEFLTLEGFNVEVAFNGLHAWERLRRPPHPDVMLLDLMMPVMSGWELMERILQDPSLRRLPVIVVSGAGATRPAPDGILASIPKPLDLEELVRALSPFRPLRAMEASF
ncbi:response regulator [Corallococcus sp. H22C18031201]|nr:response regulator [Corallococcus sp. H22C18031201]